MATTSFLSVFELVSEIGGRFNELFSSGIATADHLDEIEADVKVQVKKQKDAAWTEFNEEIKVELEQALSLIRKTAENSTRKISLLQLADDLQKTINPIRKDVVSTVRKCLFLLRSEGEEIKQELANWYLQLQEKNQDRYNSHLYSQTEYSVGHCKVIPAQVTEDSPLVDGREILQAFFDYTLEHNPRFFALGEDVGKIGDVNQAFAGLQDKYGEPDNTDIDWTGEQRHEVVYEFTMKG